MPDYEVKQMYVSHGAKGTEITFVVTVPPGDENIAALLNGAREAVSNGPQFASDTEAEEKS